MRDAAAEFNLICCFNFGKHKNFETTDANAGGESDADALYEQRLKIGSNGCFTLAIINKIN